MRQGLQRASRIATVNNGPYEPLIRWAGSKRAIIPKLLGLVPSSFGRYVEPFAGSAALFLNLRPQAGVLGDINKDLLDAFRVLRRRPDALHRRISSFRMTEKGYYELRAKSSEEGDWLTRAARFFLLNRYCFNGLYRTNREGAFNVPYGPARSGAFPSSETFRRHARLLRRAKLVCADFEEVIRANVSKADFVYIDPPYATTKTRTFNQYGPSPFNIADLERLRSSLQLIEKRKATFVLSYADCNEARDLFAAWPKYRVRTLRNISGFSSNRRRVNELLILSRNHPMVLSK